MMPRWTGVGAKHSQLSKIIINPPARELKLEAAAKAKTGFESGRLYAEAHLRKQEENLARRAMDLKRRETAFERDANTLSGDSPFDSPLEEIDNSVPD